MSEDVNPFQIDWIASHGELLSIGMPASTRGVGRAQSPLDREDPH